VSSSFVHPTFSVLRPLFVSPFTFPVYKREFPFSLFYCLFVKPPHLCSTPLILFPYSQPLLDCSVELSFHLHTFRPLLILFTRNPPGPRHRLVFLVAPPLFSLFFPFFYTSTIRTAPPNRFLDPPYPSPFHVSSTQGDCFFKFCLFPFFFPFHSNSPPVILLFFFTHFHPSNAPCVSFSLLHKFLFFCLFPLTQLECCSSFFFTLASLPSLFFLPHTPCTSSFPIQRWSWQYACSLASPFSLFL